MSGLGLRRSVMLSGPDVPCSGDSRWIALFSDLMKYGRTSSKPHPGLPSFSQLS
ncbi:MAG TPA: hypothetical protein PLV93_01800 [Microthrixaceae bacterium]|nr:hypothetical protein [Microthrixaceae bacterium]